MSSGRPAFGEYAAYAHTDICMVEGDDIAESLRRQIQRTLAILQGVPEDFATTYRYAPDKWTIKEIVGHLSDDERIFSYRLLCVARNDRRYLPGFDEKHYATYGAFNARSYVNLLVELQAVRRSTIALIEGLPAAAWDRRSMVNGYSATARGLAFHLAGHELHHLRIIESKYLVRS